MGNVISLNSSQMHNLVASVADPPEEVTSLVAAKVTASSVKAMAQLSVVLGSPSRRCLAMNYSRIYYQSARLLTGRKEFSAKLPREALLSIFDSVPNCHDPGQGQGVAAERIEEFPIRSHVHRSFLYYRAG